MNPLISPNNSLFLPLCQLKPYCEKLVSSLGEVSVSYRDKVSHEQELWSEVKKIRAFKDTSVPIFRYLIGYYHTLLILNDKTPRTPHDIFQYHILIRIGDLNRYMKNIEVASYYYCNARNLYPFFGHAYNQLGLLTEPDDHYKRCYYYARAAKSSDRPLTSIADSNLKTALPDDENELLNHVFNGTNLSTDSNQSDDQKKTATLPRAAIQWFYAMVVAIYADNIEPLAGPFLSYINGNFSAQRTTIIQDNVKMNTIHCDQDDYVMLATLDILLDWLKLGSQGKSLSGLLTPELRRIRSCLQSKIVSIAPGRSAYSLNASNNSLKKLSTDQDTSSNRELSMNISTSTIQDSCFTSGANSFLSKEIFEKYNAQLHDYILRGFKPLEVVHRNIIFRPGGMLEAINMKNLGQFSEDLLGKKFIESEKLMEILHRIRDKLDSFGPLIRRQMRNIALESIMMNASSH